MDKIGFSVTLKERDYLVFNYWHAYGRKTGKLMLIIGLVFFVELMFIFSYKIHSLEILNFLIMLMNVLFLIYIVVLPGVLFFQTRAVFKSDSFLKLEQKYVFDAVEGLDISTPASAAKIKWDQFYRMIETKKYLYAFIAKNKAYIIPKTSLDADSLASFKKMLKNSLPKEKLKLRKN